MRYALARTGHVPVEVDRHGAIRAGAVEATCWEVAVGEGGHPCPLRSAGWVADRDFGVAPSELYAVLAVDLRADHPVVGATAVPGLGDRVRARIGESFKGRAVALLDDEGGTIVVPSEQAEPDRFDEFVDGLTETARVRATAAIVFGEHGRVAEHVHTAHELLTVIRRLRWEPDLYGFADLALEFQLTRPGPGRDRLDALLNPLNAHLSLLEALRCHIANNCVRRYTAAALGVHPNTIDYRLKRIAELTGIDPRTGDGLLRLQSALVVRAYLRAEDTPWPVVRATPRHRKPRSGDRIRAREPAMDR